MLPDIFQLSAWLKIEGAGSAEISVVTYDAAGEVVRWTYAERSRKAGDWGQLKSRLVIPDGIGEILPRF